MMTFHVGDTVRMQFTTAGSGVELAPKAGGSTPIATNYVTVYTASLTGTVGDLEEVPE